MVRNFGLPELIIVLVIVLLVFGVGRLTNVFGEMGKGIRAFREGLSGKDSGSSDEGNQEKDERPS
jgi:sec-independent protein translocase protein TatA